MRFDVIDLCPSPWPGVLVLGAVWGFPTALFVLRRQQPRGSWARRQLLAGQWVLTVGAVLYTLVSVQAFDPRPGDLIRFLVICLAPATFLAALLPVLFRLVRGRRGGVA